MGPTNKQLSIIMIMRDEITKKIDQARGAIATFGKHVRDSGKSLEEFGRGMQKIGRDLTFLGAAITGPLALAFKNSAEHSEAVRDQLERLKTVSRDFQLQIATAMVPVVEKLTNVLINLSNWFNNLSPGVREMIIQGGFATGVILTLGGAFSVIIGKLVLLGGTVVKLAGNFLAFAAVNAPMLVIIATIVGIIFVMLKFENVANGVLNTFQSVFLALKQGFFDVKSHLESFVASGLENVSLLAQKMAELGGPTKGFMQDLAVSSLEAANGLRQLANEDIINAKIAALELRDIFTGENGSWADGFGVMKDEILTHIQEVLAGLANLGIVNAEAAERGKKGWTDFKKELPGLVTTLQSSLEQAGEINKGFAKAAAGIALAMAIIHTAEGVTRAFKDYPFPYSLVVGGLIAAAGAIEIATIASQKFHQGGMIRAHNGLAVDEVPIIAQRGEGVLSRRGMSALGGVSPLNALNAGIPSGRGGGDTHISIGAVYQQPWENVNELADRISDKLRRQRRYYGYT